MTFRVGQKVVCVDDSPDPMGRPIVVKKGKIYTIADVFDYFGMKGVLLDEADPGKAPGWMANRFRPIIERKTDISFAHEILRKATKPAPARALSLQP